MSSVLLFVLSSLSDVLPDLSFNSGTYPSIYYTNHSVASSNTVMYDENEALSLQSSLSPPLAQDGLGRGRFRLPWAKGRFWSKIDEKVKVLRMEFSIVENLSGPQESILSFFRRPNSIS